MDVTRERTSLIVTVAAGFCLVAGTTFAAQSPVLSAITPGKSTKASVESALGQPWRVVQFDDCGMPMPGQADETWEYRGKDAGGSYRLHVEFDDSGKVTLAAKMSDTTGNGSVEAAPSAGDSMADMGM